MSCRSVSHAVDRYRQMLVFGSERSLAHCVSLTFLLPSCSPGVRATGYGRLYLGLWLSNVLLPGTGASYNALDVVLALSAFYPTL